MTFGALLKNITFQVKTAVASFWATLYFNLWSHCFQVRDVGKNHNYPRGGRNSLMSLNASFIFCWFLQEWFSQNGTFYIEWQKRWLESKISGNRSKKFSKICDSERPTTCVSMEFFWEKIFLEKVFYYRHHARKFQRDQIGFFATNFLTKVAQIFGNFWAPLKYVTFKENTA